MFHTRLVEISDALRDRDRVRALDKLTLLARGVGGGTRIGESLARFNRWHAPREPAHACDTSRTHPGILQKSALAVRMQRSANCQGSTDETRQRR